MPKQKLLNVLLIAAMALVTGACVTLLPISTTDIRSDLGYHSLCPFAPWSTLVLLLFAGVVWLIRSYVKTQPN